ncbi:MAG: sulfatase [Planctomycetes bacterium]|nr:sulfatase [Planctomycetota bacterium]
MVRPTRVFLPFLFACSLVVALGHAQQQAPPAAPAAKPPNVVLLVADDLGYGELGCYGGKDVPTPHLDALARDGVRATSGYVTCPVCAPTRAALLTGRYQQRFGLEFNPGNARLAPADYGLPKDQPTLAERLLPAGYATGMVGKWHLGYREGARPTERGFQEFFGFLAGAHGYRPLDANAPAEPKPADPAADPVADPADETAGLNPILRGTTMVAEKQWLTAALAREAVGFAGRHHKEPFFLYVPFNAVHAPLQAPPAQREQFAELQGKRRTFAAMLRGLDDAVGAILAELDQKGQRENTLVVFLSDNGGPTRSTTSSNGPLRGFKGQVWEGGVRVPMLLRWPGRIPAGTVCDAPIATIDLAATVLAAGGLKAEGLDGRDLLPFLGGARKEPPRSELCWRFGEQRAIRQGKWKLVTIGDAKPQLFDLERDVGESKDLAADEPEVVAKLRAAWQVWDEQNQPARWARR